MKIQFTEMATGVQNFDISPCFDTDVAGCHSNQEEQEASGSEDSLVLNVNTGVLQIGRNNVLTLSENSSNVSGNENGPVLREHWKPRERLRVARSRLGFPDCEKDHLVQLLVCRNQRTRELLDIAGRYDVTVEVSYDGASGSSLQLPDYQCKRIKSKTKSDTNASMIGIIGYLFRFHEPDTKYKITFSLTAIPSQRRGKKRSVKEQTSCETICQISVTLETGAPRSSTSGKTKKKATERAVPPLFALSPPSSSKESSVLYKRSWWVVNQLRPWRNNAKWEDFDKIASDLLLTFTDADTQIAIKLEQSMGACLQNQPGRAQQLIDAAFNFMSEAKNPHLMAGRAYFHQAEILRRQGSLGKAEYYLNLGGQNIAACQTSVETILIAWERARILMDFIGFNPHRNLKLVNEARSNLEKCIDLFLYLETENSQLLVSKHFIFVIVLFVMTILLLDCDSDAARKRTVSKVFITKAQWCLDTIKKEYLSEMMLGDRVYLYLCRSDLEYRLGNYVEAEEFVRLAVEKAVEMGSNLKEASKAQERLDFMRVIRCAHTMDNGPQQSESEGENADISSSGAESDWLTELLN